MAYLCRWIYGTTKGTLFHGIVGSHIFGQAEAYRKCERKISPKRCKESVQKNWPEIIFFRRALEKQNSQVYADKCGQSFLYVLWKESVTLVRATTSAQIIRPNSSSLIMESHMAFSQTGVQTFTICFFSDGKQFLQWDSEKKNTRQLVTIIDTQYPLFSLLSALFLTDKNDEKMCVLSCLSHWNTMERGSFFTESPVHLCSWLRQVDE
jgi:hypothetical protein